MWLHGRVSEDVEGQRHREVLNGVGSLENSPAEEFHGEPIAGDVIEDDYDTRGWITSLELIGTLTK